MSFVRLTAMICAALLLAGPAQGQLRCGPFIPYPPAVPEPRIDSGAQIELGVAADR